MKYIKEFKDSVFGDFNVKRGDLIRIYGKQMLYIVLDGQHSNSEIEIVVIGVINFSTYKAESVSLIYLPTFNSENIKYIRYSFLTDDEKICLFKEMVENKKCVDLIKTTLDIDLTEIEDYKDYELKNTMNKYNL